MGPENMCSWFDVGPPVGHEYKKEDRLVVGPFSSLYFVTKEMMLKKCNHIPCVPCVLLARHGYEFRLYKNLYPKEVTVPTSYASPPVWCWSFKSIQFYSW